MNWKIARGKENQYMDLSLIRLYHENSKHSPRLVSKNSPIYEKYIQKKNDRFQYCKEIPSLNDLQKRNSSFLEVRLSDVLINRKTSWEFDNEISEADLYTFLQFSFGVNRVNKIIGDDGEEKKTYCRTYPSGGALYPIKIYVYINQVKGMKAGCFYEFDATKNQLKLLDDKIENQILNSMTAATDLKFKSYENAAFFIFLALDFLESGRKYGLLSYRLSLLEAGHISQNIMLVATAMKLSTVPIGGFFENKLNKLFQLDTRNETIVYFFPVG